MKIAISGVGRVRTDDLTPCSITGVRVVANDTAAALPIPGPRAEARRARATRQPKHSMSPA